MMKVHQNDNDGDVSHSNDDDDDTLSSSVDKLYSKLQYYLYYL